MAEAEVAEAAEGVYGIPVVQDRCRLLPGVDPPGADRLAAALLGVDLSGADRLAAALLGVDLSGEGLLGVALLGADLSGEGLLGVGADIVAAAARTGDTATGGAPDATTIGGARPWASSAWVYTLPRDLTTRPPS